MTMAKNDERVRANLYQIIRDVGTAMFTTIRPDGTLHTRPMVTCMREPMGDLWFFTTEHAPKAEEIRQDRQVALGYADAKRSVYATVSGTAEIVHDTQLKHQLWSPPLLAWFPKGPDDADLALLRVRMRTAEYWDAPSSTIIEIIAAVQAGLDQPPVMDTGEHAKIEGGRTR